MAKPLEGIRVLDMSHLLPGPFCTMLMADMGAEVIKVERPDGGDGFRSTEPLQKNEGTTFLMVNRNKKSIIVDMKDETQREFFMRLAESADVILEQFRPGTTAKLGIGYEDVRKRNPGIIYCSLSGYGQTGSYANIPGHDINYLAMTGLLDAISAQDGGAPALSGVPLADLGGAQWALTSILFALLARQKDGQGRYLDVSIAKCMVPWMTLYLSEYAVSGVVPSRGSSKTSGGYANYRIYQTGDGKYVCIGAAEPKFWARFCMLVGKPEWIADQWTEGERGEQLVEKVAELIASDTQQHWCDLLMNEDTCFTPVRTFDEVASDEGFTSSLVGSYRHPVEGDVLNLKFPVEIAGADTDSVAAAPLYGADTVPYLREAGYDEAAINNYLVHLASCAL